MTAHDEAQTLTELVAEHAGTGRRYTFVALSARSIDPATGYQPSPNLLWKVARGADVKVNPALIRAIAAGLGLPIERVAEAATRQFIGFVVGDPLHGRRGSGVAVQVVHEAGATEGDLPEAQKFVDEVLKREQGDA